MKNDSDIIIEANDDPEGYSGGTDVDHGTAKRRKSTPLKCRLVVKQRKQQQQQHRSCSNNSIAQCTSAKALGVVARGTTNGTNSSHACTGSMTRH